MSTRPSQCSPLLRSKIDGGCVAARSSAIEGFDIAADMLAHAGVVEGEMLEQRVAVWPRARRVGDGLGELLGAQPEGGGQRRQPVAAQAGVARAGRAVVAQERGEQR